MFFATLRNRSPPGPTPQFADLHQIVSSNLARLRVLSQVARAPAPHPPRQCACLRSSSTAAPAPSQTRFASRRARTSGRDRARPMRRSCEPHCLASVPPDKYPRLLRTPASDCASLQTRCPPPPPAETHKSAPAPAFPPPFFFSFFPPSFLPPAGTIALLSRSVINANHRPSGDHSGASLDFFPRVNGKLAPVATFTSQICRTYAFSFQSVSRTRYATNLPSGEMRAPPIVFTL